MQRVFALFVLAGLTACSRNRVLVGNVESSHQPAAPIASFGVFLDQGTVTVEPAADGKLSVEAAVHVVEDRLAEVNAQPLKFEDHVRIIESSPGAIEVRSAHEGEADNDDWELDLIVRCPKADTAALKARLDAGTMKLKFAKAKSLTADVDAGKLQIECDAVDGPLEASIDAGKLVVMVRDAMQSADLSVDAGDLQVTLPKDYSGEINAKVSAGNIVVPDSMPLKTDRSTVSESLNGKLGEASEHSVKLRVDAGKITIN